MAPGELLERTFYLYRRNFGLFFAIMLPPSLISSIGELAQPRLTLGSWPDWSAEAPRIAAAILFSGILSIVVHSAAFAAMTLAVSEAHQDRGITMARCYRAMSGRFGSVLGLSLVLIVIVFIGFSISGLAGFTVGVALGLVHQVLGVFGAPILLVGMAATVAWIVRYGVAMPALMLESLSVVASLRRSALLTKGSRPRVFLVAFLMLVINTVAAFVFQGPFLAAELFLAEDGAMPVWMRAMKFMSGSIGGALGGPLLPMGMALLYFDLRDRESAP